MLNLTLREQLKTFIERLLVVEERQIYKFFRDRDKHEVEYELTAMRRLNIIHEHPGKRLSIARVLPTGLHNYDAIIKAVDVLCFFTSGQVNAFGTDIYPVEISFLTSDNIIYDVTVFDYNWQGKYTLIPKARIRSLPDGENDPVNHVAVVPSNEIALKVEPLGFSVFAIVDRNGNVQFYS